MYSIINSVVNLYRLKANSNHSCGMLNMGMRVMYVLQGWDVPRFCLNIFCYIYTTLSTNNCRFSATSAEITLITNHLIIAYDEYNLQTPPTSDNWKSKNNKRRLASVLSIFTVGDMTTTESVLEPV